MQMILPKQEDAIHKAKLFSLLTKIVDNPYLAKRLRFKGGTYAAMRGVLDRFSVDLDFDYISDTNQQALNDLSRELEKIFSQLNLTIKDKSKKAPYYILKYDAPANKRNTIKLDINTLEIQANTYEPVHLPEIDRIVWGQDIPTMFANKLVAVIDRYEKTGNTAGRDLYDIYHFFLQGFRPNPDVIKLRRGVDVDEFYKQLYDFVKNKVSSTTIQQDLNTLLPYEKFKKIRDTLKDEVLVFIKTNI